MSKGIIVLDKIPESCEECPVETHFEKQNGDEYGHSCPFAYMGLTRRFREEGRAEWCPIQPMPEKKPLTGDVSNPEKVGNELIRAGWNACIDEILKGADKNV